MNSTFFFLLAMLCLGSLLIGIASTWYKVAKVNRAQGIMTMFFPPLLFLFGALNYSQTRRPYILLLAGFGSSAFLFMAMKQ